MSPRLDESSEHPTPDELAQLAAPENDPPQLEQLVGHLSTCAHCMGIYAEFVRAHAAIAADPQVTRPSAELIQMGMAVATAAPARRGFQTRRRWLVPAMTLASALVVALVMILRPAAPPSAPSLSAGLHEALAVHVRHDSWGGLLYTDALMPQDAGIRGPTTPTAAQPDLQQLIELYNRDEGSADVAYWLVAGFLATNQVRSADPYLRESLQRFPSDTRFRVLAAILSYKRDELAAAEQHLRAAVLADRSSVALLDLAIVRRQQGFEGEADALLQEVQTRFQGTPIASYAGELRTQAAL